MFEASNYCVNASFSSDTLFYEIVSNILHHKNISVLTKKILILNHTNYLMVFLLESVSTLQENNIL